jgi:hypothetical protein
MTEAMQGAEIIRKTCSNLDFVYRLIDVGSLIATASGKNIWALSFLMVFKEFLGSIIQRNLLIWTVFRVFY